MLQEHEQPSGIVVAFKGGHTYSGCADPNLTQTFLTGAVVLTSYEGKATLTGCQIIFTSMYLPPDFARAVNEDRDGITNTETGGDKEDSIDIPLQLLSLEDITIQRFQLLLENLGPDMPRLYMYSVKVSFLM